MHKQLWLNFPGTGKSLKFNKKQNPLIVPFFLCTFSMLVLSTMAGNPHEPMVWKVYNMEKEQPVQNTTTPGKINFTVPLTRLIEGGRRDKADICRGFYICPASNPGKGYCNLPGHYFCGYWGCETWASDWTTGEDKYLSLAWSPEGCKRPTIGRDGHVYGHCDELGYCKNISIIIKNPNDDMWLVGKLWGIRFWDTGPDRGSIF